MKIKLEELVKIKKESLLTTDESSLVQNNKYSFNELKNIEKSVIDSFETNYNNFFCLNID